MGYRADEECLGRSQRGRGLCRICCIFHSWDLPELLGRETIKLRDQQSLQGVLHRVQTGRSAHCSGEGGVVRKWSPADDFLQAHVVGGKHWDSLAVGFVEDNKWMSVLLPSPVAAVWLHVWIVIGFHLWY